MPWAAKASPSKSHRMPRAFGITDGERFTKSRAMPRCPTARETPHRSEIELQSQLHDARLVRGGHLPEGWRGKRRVHGVEIGAVEHVEALQPELEVRPLREPDVLEQRQVPALQAR